MVSASTSSLEGLPYLPLSQIFSDLPHESLRSLAQVNSQLNRAILSYNRSRRIRSEELEKIATLAREICANLEINHKVENGQRFKKLSVRIQEINDKDELPFNEPLIQKVSLIHQIARDLVTVNNFEEAVTEEIISDFPTLPLLCNFYKGNISDYSALDPRLKKDKEVLVVLVSRKGEELENLPETFESDKDVVVAAVKQNGVALRHASERLRDDKDVVLAAVTQCGGALHYASERLRDDKDVVLAAVTQCGGVLYRASERLRDDKDVVLAAVTQCEFALQYASERLTQVWQM